MSPEAGGRNAVIGRMVENVLALGGGAQLIASALGFHFGEHEPNLFYSFIVGVILVAPKTLGRATAGRLAEVVYSGFGKITTLSGRRKKKDGDEG